MNQARRDLEYYKNNKTCLYCKHNGNTDKSLKVICPYNIQYNGSCDGYLKQKFEWCDDNRKRVLNKLVKEAAQNNTNTTDNIHTIIVVGYFLSVGILTLILLFFTLRLRFTNPQFTETQLFIESWHQFPGVIILLLALLVLPKIIKWRNKQ